MSDKNFKVKNGIDVNGTSTIITDSDTSKGLVIKSNAGTSTANLTEWQESSGTVYALINRWGQLAIGANPVVYSNSRISLNTLATTAVGLVIRAVPSQTANLQEWQDYNGTVAAWVGSDFAIRSISGGFFGTATGSIVGVNYLAVKGWAAGHIPLAIQGVASQTGDLTRWVDSNANTLAKIDANGNLTVPSISVTSASTFSSDLTVTGNLTVSGTTTTLNSTTLVIADKNIELAKVSTPTDTTADGGGITLKGATDKIIAWSNTSKMWESSDGFKIISASSSIPTLITQAPSGQTANLQEWRDSLGNVIAKIGPLYGSNIFQFDPFSYGAGAGYSQILIGGRSITNEQRAAQSKFGVTTGEWVLGALRSTDNQVGVFGTTTTLPTFTVKSVASQTGDLQQWQDSSGNILAKIDNTGAATITTTITSTSGNIILSDSSGQAFRSVRANGYADSLSSRFFQVGTSADSIFFTALNGTVAVRASITSRYTTITGYQYNSIPVPAATLSVINGSNAADKVLIIKGYPSQTADLTQWQDSNGSVLLSVSADGTLNKTGTLNIGPILQFADPGVGNETKFIFNKTNDAAWLTVKERSPDQTYYEFGMADNALDGGDYFQWNMSQWTSEGMGWMPIQIGYNDGKVTTTRFVGDQISSWASIISYSNGPFFTYLGSYQTDTNYQVNKWTPSNSTLVNLNKNYPSSGTGTLNVDPSGYTGAAVCGYRITIQSGGTSFSYSTYGDGGADVNNVNITGGSWQTLRNGVKIKLSATGHVAGDVWSFNVYPTPGLSIGGSPDTSSLATIQPNSSNKGLIIKGAVSQTANLQEWQNSAGNNLAYIRSNGSAYFADRISGDNGISILNASGFGGWTAFTNNAIVGISTIYPSSPGLIIRGVVSQTADLQEWQDNNGTVLTNITSDGIYETSSGGMKFYAGASRTTGWSTLRNYLSNLYFNYAFTIGSVSTSSAVGSLTVYPTYAGGLGAVIKGYASQTADLQQWQNSAGTVLAKIDASGNMTLSGPSGIANLVVGTNANSTISTGIFAAGQSTDGAYQAIINSTYGARTGATLGIRASSGQTSDLTQWRDSSDTVLAKINANGVLTAPAINVVGQSVSSNTTMTSGYRYFVDTTAARTLTLPASPSVGAEVQIFDASNSAGTYNITIDPNSAKIEGVVEQYLIDVNGAAVTMTYTGSTFGWKVRS